MIRAGRIGRDPDPVAHRDENLSGGINRPDPPCGGPGRFSLSLARRTVATQRTTEGEALLVVNCQVTQARSEPFIASWCPRHICQGLPLPPALSSPSVAR